MFGKNKVLKATALTCALLMPLSACGGGSNTTADGKPILTVQVVKDARAIKMSEIGWTKDLEKACGGSI
ncbi:MAG: ABC transporter, partial [Bifidobacterium castoris]|nr:ABC transporter [Bifidobacterium castoris]